MASPKITVSCDRTFSLMLDNFSRGACGWGFGRDMANSDAILMTLLVDDSKDVLEKAGKTHCIRYALTTCF